MIDPWRTLARDGRQRQEVRQILREGVVDYSGASWAEWITLAHVADACRALS